MTLEVIFENNQGNGLACVNGKNCYLIYNKRLLKFVQWRLFFELFPLEIIVDIID